MNASKFSALKKLPHGGPTRELHVTDDGRVLSFHVANIAVTDALWLGNLISLLCDPDHASKAQAIRDGRLAIGFGKRSSLELISHNPTTN